MTVLQMNRISVGQVGVKPGSIKMLSSENLVTITTAGFLNGAGLQIQPSLQIAPSDIIECLYNYDVISDSGDLAYLQPSITNGVITLVSLNNPSILTLADGDIFVGNSSNVATAVTMSGDATLANDGAITIANDAITTAKIDDGAVTEAKIDDAAVTEDKIDDDAVTTDKILDGSVTLAKLDTAIASDAVVKFAKQVTTVGGAAAEAFTVTGAAATDLAFVQVVDNGTANVTVLQAAVTTNTLTVTFSGNPGNDCIINYQLLRATS